MLIKNVLSVFSSKIGVVLTTLLISIILARSLGVEDRGLLASILIFPQLLLALFEGGMRQAATYYISGGRSTSEHVVGSVMFYWLISGSLGFCVCFFLIYNFAGNIEFKLILLSSLILPIDLLCSFFRGYFLGKENFKKYNLVLVLPKILNLGLLSLIVFFSNVSVFLALVTVLISTIINLLQILSIIFIKEGIKPKINTKLFKEMFSKGLVYSLSLFLIVANYKVDIFILTQLSTNTQVGLYTVVNQIGESLWQLPGAIVVVLMSSSANRNSCSDNVSFYNKVLISSRLTFYVTLLSSIVLALIAPIAIPLLFGHDFEESALILLYLLPGLVFMVYFKVINSDYAGDGKPHIALYVMIPVTLLNIALNFILIPENGAIGAAVASSISYILASLIFMCYYSRSNKFSFFEFFFKYKR
jgi:O-antigen/teichoic acid export membrane protein